MVEADDDNSIVFIDARYKAPDKTIAFVKKENEYKKELKTIQKKEHEDDSEDFDPNTPQGKDLNLNDIWIKKNRPRSVHQDQTKNRKKPTTRPAQSSNNHISSVQEVSSLKPKSPKKVIASTSVSKNQSNPIVIDDSGSISSNENDSIHTTSSSDSTTTAVKRHLLLDSPDPPDTLYGLGIKCLCHHYSKIKDEPFEAVDLIEVIRDIDKSEGTIDWNGPNGVSKYCNDMEPKHFGKCAAVRVIQPNNCHHY